MGLSYILAYLFLALITGTVLRGKFRLWIIYLLSLTGVYLLQPLVPLRYFDFWFPTISIVLTSVTWLSVRKAESRISNEDILAGSLALLVVLSVALMRYIPIDVPWIAATPPSISQTLIFLALTGLIIILLIVRADFLSVGRWALLLTILGVFVVIKTEPFALWVSTRIRESIGQSVSLASPVDLNWLGFSYISFRLIHVLRDRVSGRLPTTSLREFTTYVLFFPALVAGPIDRVERFVEELRTDKKLSGEVGLVAGRRLLLGAFKKFVLADGLAILSLNTVNAPLSGAPGWTWLLLYAFCFRLYFDFSGYTDVAIGLGMLIGVKMPENFDRPYLKSNMTAFWNSWHMTLARWFRFYFFNPLTRWLRSGTLRESPVLIILIGQLSTMLLIGLWHGVTVNFAVWGLWHGLGLFIHNRWVSFIRQPAKSGIIDQMPAWIAQGMGLLVTFHYVALGWVWFALPDFQLSVGVFRTLFGFAG